MANMDMLVRSGCSRKDYNLGIERERSKLRGIVNSYKHRKTVAENIISRCIDGVYFLYDGVLYSIEERVERTIIRYGMFGSPIHGNVPNSEYYEIFSYDREKKSFSVFVTLEDVPKKVLVHFGLTLVEE